MITKLKFPKALGYSILVSLFLTLSIPTSFMRLEPGEKKQALRTGRRIFRRNLKTLLSLNGTCE